MKTVLEVPAESWVKHESSLGEACAVSPYPSAEPPQTCTSLGSQSPRRCPVSILVPGGWRKTIPVLSPSQTTWAPWCPWGLGLQGLRKATLWEPEGQAGGAMEDVFPETLGDRLWGRVGHPGPAGLINQCKKASGNQLVFIELKSHEEHTMCGRQMALEYLILLHPN